MMPDSLHSFEDVEEETGLTCCICGDGYTYKPEACMGIYTFSKVVYVEENFVGCSTGLILFNFPLT